jgi:rubrerythrin
LVEWSWIALGVGVTLALTLVGLGVRDWLRGETGDWSTGETEREEDEQETTPLVQPQQAVIREGTPTKEVYREKEIITREIVKIRCRHCGRLFEEKSNYCPHCGAPL